MNERREAELTRTWRQIGLALAVSTVGSLTLIASYWSDAGPAAEGVSLTVTMSGFAVAAGLWGRRVVGGRIDIEERRPMPSTDEARRAVAETAGLDEHHSGGPSTTRRRGIAALLTAAGGSLVVAIATPLRSLGPPALPRRETTPWRAGARVVDEDGRPLRAGDLAVGSIATVFPEGDEVRSDSQVVLVRMRSDEIDPAHTRAEWAPDGHVAYSKICTHAGCPVALYDSATKELLCPCHQSVFLASEGARPTFGPAARALPQLPLGIDDHGFLVATGDFPEPVGPSYWSRP